jgi:single-strand DNA-binding protein
VYVEGRIQTRSWDKDGVKQYRTEIVMDKFEFGPKSSGGSTSNTSAGSTSDNSAKDNAPVLPDYPMEEINPDDIPF